MTSKVWDEVIYQFPNFNGGSAEVWEWIRNFISHFMMGVIQADINLIHFDKVVVVI